MEPARVPALEGKPVANWERLQKKPQPLRIKVPSRRELKEYGPELIFQRNGPFKKILYRAFGVFEPLDMGNETACLEREDEAIRTLLAPALERLYLGQSVEGIVYFDGIETAGVVLEEPGLWDVLRVEGAYPVPVLPAGSRYEDAFLIQGALQSGMIFTAGTCGLKRTGGAGTDITPSGPPGLTHRVLKPCYFAGSAGAAGCSAGAPGWAGAAWSAGAGAACSAGAGAGASCFLQAVTRVEKPKSATTRANPSFFIYFLLFTFVFCVFYCFSVLKKLNS